MDILLSIGPGVLTFAVLITLLGGFVKGAVGFAMPMIVISGLGSVMAPELALAALILPTLISNIWQAFRHGIAAAWSSAKAQWRFLAILLICIALSAQLVTAMSDRTMFLVLGVPVTFFAAIQLIGWRPRILAHQKRRVELGVATIAGLIGGISGVWGPPTVMYLTALATAKTEQIRVQGVVYGSGAIMLAAAHIKSGVLNTASLPLSAVLIVPALIGMWLGFKVQDRLDQQRFRKMTLAVLVLAGLNLVRRGIIG